MGGGDGRQGTKGVLEAGIRGTKCVVFSWYSFTIVTGFQC